MCSFPHFSPTCFGILRWNFAHDFLLMYFRSSLSVALCVNFWRSYASLWTENIGNVQFSALFSYMLWDIEMKFCIWLWFHVLQIKFKCRYSATVWLSVRPSISCTCLLYALTIELKIFKQFDFGFFNAFLLEKCYIKIDFLMTGVLCTVCGAEVYLFYFLSNSTQYLHNYYMI